MRTMIRSLVGLSLIAMLAAPAFAQGRGGFGRFGGGSLAGLLGNASVQKELKLDDEQIGKAKDGCQRRILQSAQRGHVYKAVGGCICRELAEKFRSSTGARPRQRTALLVEIDSQTNSTQTSHDG